ncbi:MAG TPA: discoidin domain-containing protein, partial [Longimicrobium sp.]|nr:discoidin domain-containing protein [Longimicrobium sp.]
MSASSTSPGRMNSRRQRHEVRLRGLPVAGIVATLASARRSGPGSLRREASCRRRRGFNRLLPSLLVALLLTLAACAPAARVERRLAGAGPDPRFPTVVIDDFEGGVGAWSAHPSEGVDLRITPCNGFRGKGMRLDFDFRGGAGYAIARRAVPLKLPPNYEFSFRIRADAPVNDLEFKLIDPSGENVWWTNRRRFEYPREWTRLRTRKRQIEFAWGPKGGGEMDSVAQLEIVVTAATGGKGTVWIDDLTFREREPAGAYAGTPRLRASSNSRQAARAMDGDPATAWRSDDGPESLTIDFGKERELGGLTVDWDSLDYATSYTVRSSENGVTWETLAEVASPHGGRGYVYLPDAETRWLRLETGRSSRGRGAAIREIAVRPGEWSQTPNAFFTSIAKEAPRGAYPRYLTGEQSYWTVTGVSGDTREATINTDGAIETGIGGPSIEPFLHAGGRLTSWADVAATPSLAKGYLPIPSVAWDAGALRMTVTAIPAGEREASAVYARYVVENRSAEARDATLFLAVRPFQVNPPWQFLNIQGGVARVREISVEGGEVTVDGHRVLVPVTSPASFGATAFAGSDVAAFLRRGEVPSAARAADANGFASAALAYPLSIPAGGSREVLVAIPLHPSSPGPAAMREEGTRIAERLLGEAVRRWEGDLDRFSLRLPAAMHGEDIAETIKAQLAYILINRDGPSIQPGSRSYDRSWIRDGSLTSAALLRLGHPAEVREFAEWYAPHQRPNGYVPCCVSLRGADPVPEHDSHGQLVYLIAEYGRQTGDTAWVRKMWPHVERAVAYIDTLRHERMTPEYRTPDKRAFYGMLPQ